MFRKFRKSESISKAVLGIPFAAHFLKDTSSYSSIFWLRQMEKGKQYSIKQTNKYSLSSIPIISWIYDNKYMKQLT